MESGNNHLSVLSVITESLENLCIAIPRDRAVEVSNLSLGNRAPEMPLRKYFGSLCYARTAVFMEAGNVLAYSAKDIHRRETTDEGPAP